MRILIFSWRDPRHPLAGGAEQVIHEHAKGWVKAGHNVILFASRFANSSKVEVIDGIKIIRQGYQYLGVQFAGLFYYLKNKDNFDLVIDQFHGLPFFTPLYVGKAKLAVVQETAREVWFLNPLPLPVNYLVGALGFILEPIIFRLYKKVLFMTASNSAKKDIAKMGISPTNIFIVPHGVLVEKAIPLTKNKIATITFLGRLSNDKGIGDAISCFWILKDVFPKIQFWVIGQFETEAPKRHLEKRVKEYGLAQAVRFFGYVSDKQKFEMLAKSHILINPSKKEGWGLVNIEANAMGTPVVAYSNPGLVDSIKDGINGVLCKQNTPNDLAINVREILHDKTKYQKMRKNSLKWSQKFRWDISVKMSLKLLSLVKI